MTTAAEGRAPITIKPRRRETCQIPHRGGPRQAARERDRVITTRPRPALQKTPATFTPERRQGLRLVIDHVLGRADRLTGGLGHGLDTSVVFAAMAWANVGHSTLAARREAAEQAEARVNIRKPISILRLSQGLADLGVSIQPPLDTVQGP